MITRGEPLATIAQLITGPRVDNLVRRAAEQAADRTALRLGHDDVTYAGLDARVNGLATRLRETVGASGAVIGLAATLDPAFAVGFYGIARSGNVSTPINPYLGEDGLLHVLARSGAVAVIVPATMERRLAAIRDRLPLLSHVIRADELDAIAEPPPDPDVEPDALACVLFTSGTTGAPKAVPLTHRNLCVNAAQTARAQELGPTAIMLNHLPTFHIMHLNAAACATATQVLDGGDDTAEAIQRADEAKATHVYTLPMRLKRLAKDPRLPELKLSDAKALLSGGSALPVATAEHLASHFGIPVVQGYGLAEAAPLTHFNRIGNPRPGTCGEPVPGTECRVVDVDTRRPLGSGERGEIQVRGPQVMAGYLGTNDGVDKEGWLSTGDVGTVTQEGQLVLVDRTGDTFKYDNELVSPTEIEQVLGSHPAVADCVVVDRPDEIHGQVAVGYVVLRERAEPEDVREFVNRQVEPSLRLRNVTILDRIPRTGNGKVARKELRNGKVASNMVTFVNRLTVTGDQEEFERLLAQVTDYMKRQPGFRSYRLYRSTRDRKVYVETGEWESQEAHQKALQGQEFQEAVVQLSKQATAQIDLVEQVA